MADVVAPGEPYELAKWEKEPKSAGDDVKYEKYDYVDGETLESIAQRITQPGFTVTAEKIAELNWGTTTQAEINYYLKNHNGCKEDSGGTKFVLSADDPRAWLWVPVVETPVPSGKFRSPGKQDVGHVALSDHEKKHSNTLVIRPRYAIALELADVDALFEPMAQDKPWESKGVQQRLQVLGYLYTPLKHTKVKSFAKKCWEYYKMVHDRDYGELAIYSNRNYATLTIHNLPVAHQTKATVQITPRKTTPSIIPSKIILKVTGGANAGTKELDYASPRDKLGGLATAITALAGWHATADKADALSSHLRPLLPIGAQSAAHKLKCIASRRKDQTAATVEIKDSKITLKVTGGGNAGTQALDFTSTRAKLKGLARAINDLNKGWVADVVSNPEAPSASLSQMSAAGAQDAPNHQICKVFTLSNAAAMAILKQETQNNIITRTLPKSGKVFQNSKLPKHDQFAAIRFPGGYCSTAPRKDDPAPHVDDAKYDFKWNADRFAVEEAVWKDNKFLGKIPLVATVHRVLGDGKRKPADGVCVYFQLVKPDDIPDGNQLKAPALRDKEMDYSKDHSSDAAPYEAANAGPKKFVNDTYAGQTATTDPKDPQKDNVDKDYGGKRRIIMKGEGSGDAFKPGPFEVGDVCPGLHERRSDKHADYGKMTPPTVAKPDSDGAHKHAVRAITNEKGRAGVVFMPSRIGGDRYKIRAYVGSETLAFDGKDEKGPVVTTGTMVVWRNIRLRRYARMSIPTQADVSQIVHDMWSNSNTVINTVNKLWTHAATQLTTGLGTIDSDATMTKNVRAGNFKYYRTVDVDVNKLEEQYKRCYCEFIKDTKTYPEEMKDYELETAVAAGVKAAEDSGEILTKVDWDTLVFWDPTSPTLWNVRHWSHYNTMVASGKSPTPPALSATDAGKIYTALDSHASYRMMEVFTDGGVLPGLTIVQVPLGDTWLYVGNPGGVIFTSGWGMPSRGCYLCYTNGTYGGATFCYNLTANAAHELGHVLVRDHQPPTPGGDAKTHETQTGLGLAPADTCVCVMSYRGCYGDYCGRCVLAIRGWHTKIRGHDAGA